jgi:hypothetical protein
MRTGPAIIGRGIFYYGHRGGIALMLVLCLGCPALALFLSSCGAEVPLQRDTTQGKGKESPVRFSIVCVIHGDGNYLYHDTSGYDHMADEEALAGVQMIAERNPHGCSSLVAMENSFITVVDGLLRMSRTGVTRNYHALRPKRDSMSVSMLYRIPEPQPCSSITVMRSLSLEGRGTTHHIPTGRSQCVILQRVCRGLRAAPPDSIS